MLPLVLTALAFAQTPTKPMLDDLLEKGMVVPGGPKVRLPKPVAGTDPTPEERKKAAAWLVKAENKNVFEKDDRARYYIKSQYIEGKQPYHVVSVAFIAYGSLDRIEKEKLMDGLLGAKEAKGKKAVEVTDAELKARKIDRLPKGAARERYSVVDINFDDQVRITGVMRSQTSRGKRQITSTSLLDDRFLNDATYPNRSRKLTTVKGEVVEGPAMPYQGFGGYSRVTELDEPKGALFIEMYFLYHEPKAWFNGKALLESKIKIGIDENIIELRRALRSPPKRGTDAVRK
jgi:hypothetical protein